MPASMQGEMQPTIYRFKLGGFEVATILDGKSIRDGLHPTFGGNAGRRGAGAGRAPTTSIRTASSTRNSDPGQYRQRTGAVRHRQRRAAA